MEFRILGPLQVYDGDTEVPLGSPMERTLLAVLLLHGGDVVSRERLIDSLWRESPPQTAAKALNVHVSRLRKTLARNGHDPIATRAPGYQLGVDPEQVDAARFERLVAEARAQAAAGDAESASRLLREALALWRGPALSGIDLAPASSAEIARLEELRVAAQMERIDCELALGQHEQLICELEALVREHPLYERLHGQYMLALYRSGRQADALAAYQDARRRLMDELGIEPGEDLRRLQQEILNQDPRIAGPARRREPPSRPRARARSESKWHFPLSRRARVALVLGALVVAGVSAGIVTSLTSSGSTATLAGPSSPYSIATIDPQTDRLTRIALAGPPTQLALGEQALWVANARDQTLIRLDPRSRRVERTVGIPLKPTAVAVGEGAVWVLGSGQGALVRFNTASELIRMIKLPMGDSSAISVGDPTGLAVGAGAVWVEDGVATLFRIDPETGAAKAFKLGKGLDGVAVGGGSVWVTKGSPPTLLRIDPHSGSVTARIPIARRADATAPFPIGVTFGANSVWVLNGNTGTVTRVDPTLDAVAATVDRVSMDPIRVGATGRAVWVTDGDDALIRIDPTTGRVAQVIPLTGLPTALAVRSGAVWVGVDAT